MIHEGYAACPEESFEKGMLLPDFLRYRTQAGILAILLVLALVPTGCSGGGRWNPGTANNLYAGNATGLADETDGTTASPTPTEIPDGATGTPTDADPTSPATPSRSADAPTPEPTSTTSPIPTPEPTPEPTFTPTPVPAPVDWLLVRRAINAHVEASWMAKLVGGTLSSAEMARLMGFLEEDEAFRRSDEWHRDQYGSLPDGCLSEEVLAGMARDAILQWFRLDLSNQGGEPEAIIRYDLKDQGGVGYYGADTSFMICWSYKKDDPAAPKTLDGDPILSVAMELDARTGAVLHAIYYRTYPTSFEGPLTDGQKDAARQQVLEFLSASGLTSGASVSLVFVEPGNEDVPYAFVDVYLADGTFFEVAVARNEGAMIQFTHFPTRQVP